MSPGWSGYFLTVKGTVCSFDPNMLHNQENAPGWRSSNVIGANEFGINASTWMAENGKYDGCGMPAGAPETEVRTRRFVDSAGTTNLQPTESDLGWKRTLPGASTVRGRGLWTHQTSGEKGRWTSEGLQSTWSWGESLEACCLKV